MTPTPKEGPPTLRECLDMVVYLRRGLMTLNDREKHGPGITDKENEQKLLETGKAWISDADDYVERLKPYAIGEALELDEKRRAALEEIANACRAHSHPMSVDRCSICAKLDELDALTPTPKEKE